MRITHAIKTIKLKTSSNNTKLN